MTTKHDESVEQCKEIFIEWTKAQRIAIGVLIGGLLSIASATWAAATILNANANAHARFEFAISTIDASNTKLDTVLKLLREQREPHATIDNR
jgi:hypothetical protein